MSAVSQDNVELTGEEKKDQLVQSVSVWIRAARLWSGMILFVYLSMHLTNHALGIFGQQALDAGQTLRWLIWMNPVGLTLLYGSLLVHFMLAFWRIASRKTLRMPLDELAQLLLGVMIPVLLLPHLLHTRVAGKWFGGSGFYADVLAGLWPNSALWQISLVIVAWSHGVIGIWMAFRHRNGFKRFQLAGLVLAIFIVSMSIAGFIAAGREAARIRAGLGANIPQTLAFVQNPSFMDVKTKAWYGLGGLAVLLVLVTKLGYFRRRFGDKIAVNYRGRGPVLVPTGTSVLEASRLHEIPHPSVCRGRGRCATCRVQILSESEGLPEPSELEKATLSRVGANKNIRLACQLRPTGDIDLRILLPVLGSQMQTETDDQIEEWVIEREATILALNLRAFNVLLQNRLPYELAALVNRFGSEMRQAVENHGGAISTFNGDGLIAVFDHPKGESSGAKSALAAARDMDRVLKALNHEMGDALPIPIRAGIGIHSGAVTLARVSTSKHDTNLMSFGVGVTIASVLQNATKSLLVDYLCSEATARLARLDTASAKTYELPVEGIETPILAIEITTWVVGADKPEKMTESAA